MNNAPHALGDYKVGKRIASGGFGFVYSGKALNGKRVAIKYERTYKRITRPYLQHEAEVYRLLEGHPCVPKVYAYGREGHWNIMVFDLLGTSLETLLEKCDGKFSLKTMLMLAPQIIECIEYIHSKGIIHRDIKPDNFLVGTGDRTNFVHIIDFGLSRRFRHPRSLEHFPYFEGHNFFGTTRFASLKALEGCSQSRRDDLESAAYSLVYFMRGRLPWQGLRGGTEKHRDQRVREKKRTWTPERLCEGLPGAEELVKMLHYVKSLDYTDEPDYAYLKGLFTERFKKEGYELDYDYDWLQIVDKESDSGDGPSATGSRLASGARRSADARVSVDSGSEDDELDVSARKVPGSPTSKPKIPPSIKTDSEISPISATDYLKNRVQSRNESRSRPTPATRTTTRSDAPRSSVSKLGDGRRSRSEGSLPSSTDSSIDGEVPIRKGDLILVKFLASPTLEKGSLKSDSSVPVDTSYWHNPELSEAEWHFPFRPALVTKVDVWDEYTRLSVLPVMQRPEGLEKISPPRRPAFFELVAGKEDAAAGEKGKDDQDALKIQTSPTWPLAGTYVQHQFDTFKIHVPTDNVKDIKVIWRLDKDVLKSFIRARDDIVSVLNDDDYLSDAGSETGWVRRRFRRRRTVAQYPLFGDIASLTEEALARPDVDLQGSNGWLPEFFKVDRRRNHENGYYTGDSDYEDDENESCYTGPAPGNRRLSCTLEIDGDAIKEASQSDHDSVASSRYRSPRSSGAGSSYRSGASSRHSRASSPAGAKARDARSLRHAILDSAVPSGYNTPVGSDSSRPASPYSPSSPIGYALGSSCSLSTQVSLPPGSAGSSPGSSAGFSSSRPGSASDNCSRASSNVGSIRSAVDALTGVFEGMNEAATAIERKIMVDKGVQTTTSEKLDGPSSPGISIKTQA